MSDSSANDQYLAEKQVNAPSTIGEAGRRQWLYPDRRPGPRATRRMWIAVVLIGVYFVVPFLSWNGSPLVRVDILNETAHFFGIALNLTEYNNVFFLLFAAGLMLFLVTTLRGRIWCGYACPQTVFVEWVIRPIEELIEGNHQQRRKIDSGKKTPAILLKKVILHVAFLAVAFVVANAFLAYFVAPAELIMWITSPPSEHPIAFGFVMFVIGIMYFDLGWFREQFCSFLCPYARFQSALLDDKSPSVQYDGDRGEPRGKGKGKGDCIDCKLCVRVCPTGIDIRNGLQLECIQCERCVDACESIMTNLKRPTGLIRIASTDQMAGVNTPFYKRVRVWVYSSLIAIAIGIGFVKISGRDPVSLTFVRQEGTTYTEFSETHLANVYKVRILNNTSEPTGVDLVLPEGQDNIGFVCARCTTLVDPHKEIVSPFFITFPKDYPLKSIRVKAVNGKTVYTLPLIKPGN